MNERYQLLAALNGIAFKCIYAFTWEQRQITVSELEPLVGHDKNTVRKALAQLALYGLASQVIGSQETWCLTDKGYQLPLPLNALAPPGGCQTASGENFTSGEKFSPPTTTTLRDYTKLPLLSSSSSTSGGENFTTDQTANLKACHQDRIFGKKAEKLAGLDWVTPEYIHAHVAQVKRDGQRLGLAIRRIEDGDPAPEPPPDQNETVAESWRRYIQSGRRICPHCGQRNGRHAVNCEIHRQEFVNDAEKYNPSD